MLPHILPLIPNDVNSYYEPFLGGGALYFALQPPDSFLSDTNPDLINCYLQVRKRPEELTTLLAGMRNSEADYYRVRSETPMDSVARAARLIYLTALAFNGIYRLNLHGQFNVPYGHRTHSAPCDPDKIRKTSDALSPAHLSCEDFEEATRSAGEGALVYLDPPYTVAHGNNGFLRYNSKIYTWHDQVRLAEVAKALSNRGCRVLVSNADHPAILALYEGFRVKRISRGSQIAASSQARRPVSEIIFYNEV